ncbi:hypothetical protein GCM10023085_50940 [Actinomadura viridis]
MASMNCAPSSRIRISFCREVIRARPASRRDAVAAGRWGASQGVPAASVTVVMAITITGAGRPAQPSAFRTTASGTFTAASA